MYNYVDTYLSISVYVWIYICICKEGIRTYCSVVSLIKAIMLRWLSLLWAPVDFGATVAFKGDMRCISRWIYRFRHLGTQMNKGTTQNAFRGPRGFFVWRSSQLNSTEVLAQLCLATDKHSLVSRSLVVRTTSQYSKPSPTLSSQVITAIPKIVEVQVRILIIKVTRVLKIALARTATISIKAT